jgi:hypothetical protein
MLQKPLIRWRHRDAGLPEKHDVTPTKISSAGDKGI